MVAVACARFHVGGYQRELVESAEGHELWRLSWAAGDCTTIHDHGGAATESWVASGRLFEERFARRGNGVVRVAEESLLPGTIDRHGPEIIHRVYALEPTISFLLYLPGSRDHTTYELLG